MQLPGTIKMTANQYLQLGEDPPGTRLELVDGQIAVGPGKYFIHAHAEAHLCYTLLGYIKDHDLGWLLGGVDVVLGEYDVRRPDISFYKKSRVHLIDRDDALRYAPDFCAEVTSESSEEIDRVHKFRQYAEAGIPYYWIIDPEKQTIEAFELNKSHYERVAMGRKSRTIALPPFPELPFSVQDLWWPHPVARADKAL
jgi:Uma2 family endonuclease